MTDAERDACYRRIEQSLRNAIGTESQPWYDLIAMIEDENKRRKQMADLTGLTPQQLMDWREDDSPFNWYDIDAEIERRLLRAQQAEKALRTLIDRLDAVHADPQYESVWQLYMIHGGDYTNGPRYDRELEAARVAIGDEAMPNERFMRQYYGASGYVGERPPTPTMSREEAERIAAQWVYHGGSPYESDNILLESLAGLLQSVARGERPQEKQA